MTPADQFRAGLKRAQQTQSGFARLLHRYRPETRLESLARQVRRWANGEVPPPAEALLALDLLCQVRPLPEPAVRPEKSQMQGVQA